MVDTRTVAFLGLLLLALARPEGGTGPPALGPSATLPLSENLAPQTTIALNLRRNQSFIFRLDVPKGTLFNLTIEPQGESFELFLWTDRITPFEIRFSDEKAEPHEIRAVSKGPVYLVIADNHDERSTVTEAGKVKVRWSYLQQTSRRDELHAIASHQFFVAEALHRRLNEAAQAHYELSRLNWLAAGDQRKAEWAEYRRGRLLEDIGDQIEALPIFERLVRSGLNESGARVHLAFCYDDLGQLNAAEAIYVDLIAKATADGNHEAATSHLQNLAILRKKSGRLKEALEAYNGAIQFAKSDNSRATYLYNRGNVFLDLGRYDEATDDYRASLALTKKSDHLGQAWLYRTMAMAQTRAGRLAQAESLASSAISLARRSRNEEFLALCWITRGELEQARRNLKLAREYFLEAVRLAVNAPPAYRANALASLGHVEAQMGVDIEAGIEKMQDALVIYRSEHNVSAEIDILREIGIAQRAIGRPLEAKKHFEQAIELIEELRALSPSPEIRASLFSSRRKVFELLVDLDLGISRENAQLATAEEGFEAAENARARVLLDDLSGERATSPATLQDARKYLASDTILLFFSLGEARSALFLVGKDRFDFEFLPGRSAVEKVVSPMLADLGARPGFASERNRENLRKAVERMILPKDFNRWLSGSKRLVVCPDGILDRVPFGMLHSSDQTGPIIDTHELVVVPSLSVLARLRRGLDSARASPLRVAVLAAPLVGRELPPLDGAAREARVILSMFGRGRSRAWIGRNFDRSALSAVASGEFDVVHIATHAFERGDGTSFGFAVSPPRMNPSVGYDWVSAEDIYSMAWRAELVVLAGCETGGGPEVVGEGVKSLGRAFLHGGVRRVVVSHWRVDDRATAELMGVFYSGLRRGLLPVVALREAQLSLARTEQFGEPFYWAGFSLVGDWL